MLEYTAARVKVKATLVDPVHARIPEADDSVTIGSDDRVSASEKNDLGQRDQPPLSGPVGMLV